MCLEILLIVINKRTGVYACAQIRESLAEPSSQGRNLPFNNADQKLPS